MIVHMEEEYESVAACAHIKDDIKQMKTTNDMTYTVQWSMNR